MRDGFTEKLKTMSPETDRQAFFEQFNAKLVALTGRHAGMEYALEQECVTMGRGPGVDLAFDDPAMSRQHAAVDYSDGGFRIRDLGSTNGLRINGNRVQADEIKHGDRLEVGTQVFQLVIEEREDTPNTYELTPDV
jgi:pSer/pThr/pTyr-binding forkhead associated (FHA) protein